MQVFSEFLDLLVSIERERSLASDMGNDSVDGEKKDDKVNVIVSLLDLRIKLM